MFYYLTLPFTSLLDFFDRGGPVIIVLFILAIIMTSLLIERLLFFISELNDLSDISHQEVILFKQENNWVFNKIKSKNISVINVAANKNLLLIQGCLHAFFQMQSQLFFLSYPDLIHLLKLKSIPFQ